MIYIYCRVYMYKIDDDRYIARVLDKHISRVNRVVRNPDVIVGIMSSET